VKVDVERSPLVGETWVNLFTAPSLLDTLDRAVQAPEQVVVVNHNVNSLVQHQRTDDLRQLYRTADACFVDGMPIVWMGRLLGEELRSINRLGVLDWIWPLLSMAEVRGWRVAHLGGTPQVDADSAERIRERHPGIVYSSRHGYFDHEPGSIENDQVLRWLQEWSPDLLLVGMGMPLQETWLNQNLDRLPQCTVVTVGGIMGFLAGERPTAPRWMGPLGVEWAFRLLTEPRRLARRYLVEPWGLVPPLVRELVHRRSGSRTDDEQGPVIGTGP
jgi:N-acetylglucosaminyldiphosphoundecaprenol N-acetyl-beta-D-mannosaminyltransferase